MLLIFYGFVYLFLMEVDGIVSVSIIFCFKDLFVVLIVFILVFYFLGLINDNIGKVK